MKKCEYCAKEISYFDQYCCEECEAKTLRFHEKTERHSKLFLVLNTICVFAIPIGLFLAAFSKFVGLGIAVSACVILGIVLMVMPFPTEGMIKKHKLEKAIKISRGFGVAVIGLGAAIGGLIFVFN